MEKKIFLIIILLFGFSINSFALSFGNVQYEIRPGDGSDLTVYSGTYLFTSIEPSNDTFITRDAYYSDFLGLIAQEISNISGYSDYSITNLSQYQKIDAPTESTSDPAMMVSYDSNNKTGTWSIEVPVEFYTVKAADEFAIYWLGIDGASSGNWSTEHLVNNGGKQPTISHLTTWNSLDSPAPVPEPSTLLLFGAGLMGFAVYQRRKK